MFHDEPKTLWWAIFGVICFIVVSAVLWPVRMHPPIANPRSRSLSNMKQLGQAINLYSTDWNDLLPHGSMWESRLSSYIKIPRIFEIYTRDNRAIHRSALNQSLSHVNILRIESPEYTVEVFESGSRTKDQIGDRSLVGYDPKELKTLLLFVDSHVKSYDYSSVGKLGWTPQVSATKSSNVRNHQIQSPGRIYRLVK